jgi:hypothetical protein
VLRIEEGEAERKIRMFHCGSPKTYMSGSFMGLEEAYMAL